MTVPSAGFVLHPCVDADGVSHFDERALRLDDALDDALCELVLGALDVVVVERELDERVGGGEVAVAVREGRGVRFFVSSIPVFMFRIGCVLNGMFAFMLVPFGVRCVRDLCVLKSTSPDGLAD